MNIKAFALTTLAAATLVAAPAQAAQQFTNWNDFVDATAAINKAEKNANDATYCQLQKKSAELYMNNFGLATTPDKKRVMTKNLRINLEDLYQYCADRNHHLTVVKPNAGYVVEMNFTENAWGDGMRKDDYNCGKYGAQSEAAGFGTDLCTFHF